MYLLVRRGIRRVPDRTLTSDCRREVEVRSSKSVEALSRGSGLVLHVEDAEEDVVGGVGRLWLHLGHADNDVASLFTRFSSGLGDEGAVGREGASSSTMSGFAIVQQKEMETGGGLQWRELGDIGHQPVQNSYVVCLAGVCRRDQGGGWQPQRDSRLEHGLGCLHLS